VVLWDSAYCLAEYKTGVPLTTADRVTAHTAIGDFDPAKDGFRHGARITPQAERPTL
jgi:hypothetical protein